MIESIIGSLHFASKQPNLTGDDGIQGRGNDDDIIHISDKSDDIELKTLET